MEGKKTGQPGSQDARCEPDYLPRLLFTEGLRFCVLFPTHPSPGNSRMPDERELWGLGLSRVPQTLLLIEIESWVCPDHCRACLGGAEGKGVKSWWWTEARARADGAGWPLKLMRYQQRSSHLDPCSQRGPERLQLGSKKKL